MVKKRKITTFSKIKDITRIDEKTFYVPSSDPDRDPYVIFNSDNEGWLCDCMSFVMNMTDTGYKDCKHILRIKKEYNIKI